MDKFWMKLLLVMIRDENFSDKRKELLNLFFDVSRIIGFARWEGPDPEVDEIDEIMTELFEDWAGNMSLFKGDNAQVIIDVLDSVNRQLLLPL
jgi:hypothetical protein